MKETIMNDIEKNIGILENYKTITVDNQIKSHRKFVGFFITAFKRVIRKSIYWYIKPLEQQQNKVNDININVLKNIKEFNDVINNEINTQNLHINEVREKEMRIKELEEKVLKIQVLEEEALKIQGLEEKISIINDIDFKLEKLNKVEKDIERIKEEFKFELKETTEFFNKKSYSQSGEDTIIAYIFKYLGIDINKIKYLDLGANHAKELSNTNYFYENGAQGVLVEANPSLIPELHFYRHNDIILNKLVSSSGDEEMDFYVLSGDGLSTPDKEQAEETCRINPTINIEKVVKVTSITVNDIFEKYFGGSTPDFISIDVEGYDLEILKSIDLDNYRPLVIVAETIEYRPYLPINVKVDNVEKYLKTKDYVEYAFTGINSIFIDAKRMKELNQDK